jgi:hypothetical protein
VPRFYLEAFCCDGLITRLDLTSGEVILTSVQNVAIEKGLYDVEASGTSLSAESWLSGVVESFAVPVIRQLSSNPEALVDLSQVDQLILARFLAAQRFRVPSFRSFIERTNASLEREMATTIESVVGYPIAPEELRSYVDMAEIDPPAGIDVGSAAMISALSGVQGWANILLAQDWRIGRAPDGRRFYTSDNPLAGYLTPVRPFGSGGALWEYDFVFPLSPDVLIKITPVQPVDAINPWGRRRFSMFTHWECSFARHIVSDDAEQYLLGSPPFISRDDANAFFRSFDVERVRHAERYQGFTSER